ncbi:MAG TPA: GMC family oxidoreductase [Caulobacteraceae bacterium]|nr:GMC family oxidoreductase [Caulobacteraceae bacterium]
MREHADDELVDFVIVGSGAGGATLAAKLSEAGFSVVVFDAGPFWRPLEEFASDELEQHKLYWTDERIVAGADPIVMGANNSGRGVGGSTVHFAMISLRLRPDIFRSRSKLGYGVDWPVSWDEIEPYYTEAERALKVSGPVSYPWPSKHGPYPYRPHEINGSGQLLGRAAEKLGIKWCATPLATVSAPRGKSPPCVYRGFCVVGCSTNAKQSALIVWIPRALKAGAEVRDMAMVTRVEIGQDGLCTGVTYRREGRERFQRARNVVVAGYSVETPRLLLNSACPQFPDGLANSTGLVGKYLTIHSSPGIWATFEDEVRMWKGPPNMAVSEHWNYSDGGKDFFGGYSFMSQGPLPITWAQTVAGTGGMWGARLRDEMVKYNHMAGLGPVGETESQLTNGVELADEVDRYGLRIPKITFSYSDNDKALQRHAIAYLSGMLEVAGGRDVWTNVDTSHLMGTCRMGFDAETSVVDKDGRSWDIPNLWVCDGSLFPTSGGVNPSLTIQALACRIGDRIATLSKRGELSGRRREAVS